MRRRSTRAQHVTDPDVVVDAGPDVSRLEGKIVFVTGAEFSVGLGNQLSTVGAANKLCEDAAGLAGLQGTFVAWISDDRAPPPIPALADAAPDAPSATAPRAVQDGQPIQTAPQNTAGELPESAGHKRTSKNTPALTMVAEWRKAETGVGAAIALGSQK